MSHLFVSGLPDRELKNQNFFEKFRNYSERAISEKPSGYYDTLLRQNTLLSCCLLIHTLFSNVFP